MKFTLSIDCNNAAFENIEQELERILKVATIKIRDGCTEMLLRDINGNFVGYASLNGDE